MTDPQIPTQFSLLPVAQSAIVGAAVCAAATALWQFPAVREFATSAGFKNAVLDGITKLIDGAGGSSTIASA